MEGFDECQSVYLVLTDGAALILLGTVRLALDVTYPDDYPDVLPELSLHALEGELKDGEVEQLLKDLQALVSRYNSPVHGRNSSLTPFAGRRKSRHGHDLHACITSTRTVVRPREVTRGTAESSRGGKRETGNRSL